MSILQLLSPRNSLQSNRPNAADFHKKYNKHIVAGLEFKAGNNSDFTLIFQVFYKQLCYFSNKMLCDWNAAEDIVVDVFIKLWISNGNFKRTGAIKAWLYKCTYNDCIKHINKNKRQLGLVVDLIDNDNKLFKIIKDEELAVIYTLVESLPPQCKSVMKLYYFLGLENTQIAGIFNISPHTVKNQKARGIYLIKKRMKGYAI
jgi:RNA polymerase sigma factor (sigma-70 family)